jgi:hypothetical protein
MRRRRTRHPLVSLALFLIVGSMGWVTWEFRDELKYQRDAPILDSVLRERVEEAILDEFDHDACFFDLRGHLNWRPNERRYRLDILMEESSQCEKRADEICQRIAQRIHAESEIVATVVAFDSAGREVGRCVL